MIGCCPTPAHPTAPAPPRDPHSHAQPDRVAVRHAELDLRVDFGAKLLRGTVRLAVVRRDPSAPLILDADNLAIDAVTDCATQRPLAHTLGPREPVIGSALRIEQPTECVAIAYATGPDARALLWVAPSGTASGEHPMLFTQSQAINARTWIPIQDTPSVRFTYQARIDAPAPLRAVMSADNSQRPSGTQWSFRMDRPIPSYLLALAVGDLAFRTLGPRTGVYAEPSLIDAAAAEFAEVEAMLGVVEQLYGPYQWGRYDLLVLPPSFPFGGMENPKLTFLTPTVLTGDRALVSLIAHELAHSWSGNLVTNATWSDFWLNEGFTTYVERRIMEALRGKPHADIAWLLGRRDLTEAFGRTPADDTKLALAISAARDPDDVPSDAAYEKGALFLQTLELAFGRAVFDQFLRDRFARRAFQSTTSDEFERDLAGLIAAHPGKFSLVTARGWIHDPGIPRDVAAARSSRVDELNALASQFADSGALPAADRWTTVEWIVFLRGLPTAITVARVRELDAAYHLTATRNAQLAKYWLPIAIRADAREAAPAIEAYLMRVGRRWLITDVYEALVAAGGSWRELAVRTYERAKPLYHPIVRGTLEKLLKT